MNTHQINILVVGRHAELMEIIITLLRKQGYSATGKQTNEEAIVAFQDHHFDGVVIGGGVDKESRMRLKTEFKLVNPAVVIIDAHPGTIISELKKNFPISNK